MKKKKKHCAADKSFTKEQNHTPYPVSTLPFHQNEEMLPMSMLP